MISWSSYKLEEHFLVYTNVMWHVNKLGLSGPWPDKASSGSSFNGKLSYAKLRHAGLPIPHYIVKKTGSDHDIKIKT